MIYTVHQAKTQLSRLIAAAEQGEDVIIARGDEPVVRLQSLNAARPTPKFGAMKGRIALTEAFFEPLPDDERALWEGGPD
jgi:antitoxin (DNA-binding transcriptional repressor) of toxin-antitoxin stability system